MQVERYKSFDNGDVKSIIKNIDNLFIYENKAHKKYKIYLFKDFSNKIVYVGITNQLIINRLKNHISTRDIKKGNYYIEQFRLGNKLTVEITFDYNSKLLASITERILIDFVRRFINPDLLNRFCNWNEEIMLTEHPCYTKY